MKSVHEKMLSGEVLEEAVSFSEQEADILTKPLNHYNFERLQGLIGECSSP